MPKIERIIWLRWNGENIPFKNCEGSDSIAIRKAAYALEIKEGKMLGSLQKYFKENPGEIVVVIK